MSEDSGNSSYENEPREPGEWMIESAVDSYFSEYQYGRGRVHYFGMPMKHDYLDDEFMDKTIYFAKNYDKHNVEQQFVVDMMRTTLPAEKYVFENKGCEPYMKKYNEILKILGA